MSAANVYYGVPGNIASMPTPPATVNISSSTNASPIVITTAAPHGLQTGEQAVIAYHLVNTAANGVWNVTRLSATTFSLNGSTGNGVGVATGTSTSLGLGGFEMPEDGVDPIDASTFNIPPEALGDRTAFTWAQFYLGLKRPLVVLPDADETITHYSDLYTVPDVSALRVYTLPDPTLAALYGRRLRFRFKRELVTGNTARIMYNGNIICSMPGGGGDKCWADVDSTAANDYTTTAWGGDTTPVQ